MVSNSFFRRRRYLAVISFWGSTFAGREEYLQAPATRAHALAAIAPHGRERVTAGFFRPGPEFSEGIIVRNKALAIMLRQVAHSRNNQNENIDDQSFAQC